MASFLGIDTSNYTTSLAISRDGIVEKNIRKILDVKEGQRGLRQSDAVFAHTVNLPILFDEMGEKRLDAVGVSSKPRDVDGSYMPCFLSGVAAGEAIARINGIPLYRFSHQSGHIAAALYSASREDLINKEFIAFHVSGGTTEVVYVNNMKVKAIGGTRDISAGKLIDRAGMLLGFKFPCGKELEASASDIDGIKCGKISVDGLSCNLSGIENIIEKLVADGADKGFISATVIMYVYKTIDKLTENVIKEYGGLPLIYSGGVMSNTYIKSKLTERYGGFFAAPELSCDNAAGIARLAELKHNGSI